MKNFEKYRPGYFTPPMDISQIFNFIIKER